MSHSSLIRLWNSHSKSELEYKPTYIDSQLSDFTKDETESILECISNISHESVNSSNKEKFNAGWGQNLSLLTNGLKPHLALTPCYFGKYSIVRIFGSFYSYRIDNNINTLISSISNPLYEIPQEKRYISLENFLYRELLQSLVFAPFLQYCLDNDWESCTIADLGAGTCHNLLHLSYFFKLHAPQIKLKLIATDWSSSTKGIVRRLTADNTISDLFFCEFDYFRPDTWSSLLEFSPNLLYSIASLEQFPSDTLRLLEFLVTSSLSYAIHLEPVKEILYSPSVLDKQSISYMRSRNYLNDFASALLAIEMHQCGKIKSSIFRTGLGSLFIDGYTHLSWNKK